MEINLIKKLNNYTISRTRQQILLTGLSEGPIVEESEMIGT
jgi:hypothetical protein